MTLCFLWSNPLRACLIFLVLLFDTAAASSSSYFEEDVFDPGREHSTLTCPAPYQEWPPLLTESGQFSPNRVGAWRENLELLKAIIRTDSGIDPSLPQRANTIMKDALHHLESLYDAHPDQLEYLHLVKPYLGVDELSALADKYYLRSNTFGAFIIWSHLRETLAAHDLIHLRCEETSRETQPLNLERHFVIFLEASAGKRAYQLHESLNQWEDAARVLIALFSLANSRRDEGYEEEILEDFDKLLLLMPMISEESVESMLSDAQHVLEDTVQNYRLLVHGKAQHDPTTTPLVYYKLTKKLYRHYLFNTSENFTENLINVAFAQMVLFIRKPDIHLADDFFFRQQKKILNVRTHLSNASHHRPALAEEICHFEELAQHITKPFLIRPETPSVNIDTYFLTPAFRAFFVQQLILPARVWRESFAVLFPDVGKNLLKGVVNVGPVLQLVECFMEPQFQLWSCAQGLLTWAIEILGEQHDHPSLAQLLLTYYDLALRQKDQETLMECRARLLIKPLYATLSSAQIKKIMDSSPTKPAKSSLH
ncbi:MAG: hypothetical protein ACK5O7_05130 [Holosporales bacterium]